MAEFYRTYPGLVPGKLTISVFEGLVNEMCETRNWTDGRWTDEDALKAKTAEENQRLIWQHHLSSFYDDPFSQEEDARHGRRTDLQDAGGPGHDRPEREG
jgi:hypothetical protein